MRALLAYLAAPTRPPEYCFRPAGHKRAASGCNGLCVWAHLASNTVLLLSIPGTPPPATSASGILPLSIASIPLLPSAANAGSSLALHSSPASPLAGWAPPSKPSAAIQATPPFHLASSFSPILVRKIEVLEFIEMRDLFPDNIALAEHLEALPSHRAPSKAPETREVRAPSTWVAAFSTYVAIVAAEHPGRVRDMLAYLRLLVSEAQKYGGSGWITYDQVFRRNRPGPEARWDQLDSSLHIAYIATQADSPATPCSICSEVDHSIEDCALTSLTPSTKKVATPPPGAPMRDMVRGIFPRSKRQPLPRSQAAYPSKRICLLWNGGKCAYPGACNYRHVCATCRGQHPAQDCAQTPGFRQNRLPQTQGPPAKDSC